MSPASPASSATPARRITPRARPASSGSPKSSPASWPAGGITSNAVAPGFITTDMTEGLPEALKTVVVGQIPLGKFGEPADIAAAVAFLASTEAKYITGQVLSVDGGMVM
ncbi:MAG: SDR family oxidoreductase [Chthoniobacter sp.]